MRFYVTPQGIWFTPGTINPKSAVKTEVPTDSQGLCEFLNDYRRQLKEAAPAEAVPPPPPSAAADTASSPAIDVGMIEEFILDMATVGQVERLFACLGTRFAELRPKLHG